jgi:peptidoglycan/LPS O-acetylase OafA/YrhL
MFAMHQIAAPPETAPSRSRNALRADIQGMRGLAVGLVFLYHAKVPFIPGGYVGVDVFFVISGYLISKHLVESIDRSGRVGFGAFYARRARRLLPAALVVIVLTALASVIWLPPLQLGSMFDEAIASTLYVPNVLLAANGTNYLAETTPSMFQQYWSLGVEEQFYLVWPALLVGAVWLTRSRRKLVLVISVLVAFSFAGCVLLSRTHQPLAFFLLPTRAWEFGVGALVALAGSSTVRLGRTVAAALGWTGFVLVAAAGVFYTEQTVYPGFAALAPVAGAAIMIFAGSCASPQQANPLMVLRPLTFVGDISYSLYLVHWPLLVLPQAAVGLTRPLSWTTTAVLALACLPAAYVLHRYVERRLISAAWLARARPRRTLLTTLLVSSLLAVTFLGGQAVMSRQVLSSPEVAGPTTVSVPPTSTPYVPVNLRPSLRSADGDVPSLYGDGCHLDFDATRADGCSFGSAGAPRIALFGDSHAAQWFPALEVVARDHNLQLETYTKSSCPSVSVATQLNGSPYAACTAWRENVLRHLVADPPAMVIIANYGAPSTAGAAPTAGWQEGLSTTLARLQPVTKVAVIADSPNLGQTPSICLSAHLTSAEECGRPRQTALDSPARTAERAAVAAAGVQMIDFTDFLCTQSFCPAIIGDTLVYRDAHHLTATYSTELNGVLWERIRPVLGAGS